MNVCAIFGKINKKVQVIIRVHAILRKVSLSGSGFYIATVSFAGGKSISLWWVEQFLPVFPLSMQFALMDALKIVHVLLKIKSRIKLFHVGRGYVRTKSRWICVEGHLPGGAEIYDFHIKVNVCGDSREHHQQPPSEEFLWPITALNVRVNCRLSAINVITPRRRRCYASTLLFVLHIVHRLQSL